MPKKEEGRFVCYSVIIMFITVHFSAGEIIMISDCINTSPRMTQAHNSNIYDGPGVTATLTMTRAVTLAVTNTDSNSDIYNEPSSYSNIYDNSDSNGNINNLGSNNDTYNNSGSNGNIYDNSGSNKDIYCIIVYSTAGDL